MNDSSLLTVAVFASAVSVVQGRHAAEAMTYLLADFARASERTTTVPIHTE